MTNFLSKYRNWLIALIAGLLVPAALVQAKSMTSLPLASSSGTVINCMVQGACSILFTGSSVPSISAPDASVSVPTKFGSGTETAAFGGNLTVAGTETVTGATTNVGSTTFTGGITVPAGVGTSTVLSTNGLTVTSGVAAASSTIELGSSFNGATAQSIICLWNGTNFQKLWIAAPGQAFSSSTSATCP